MNFTRLVTLGRILTALIAVSLLAGCLTSSNQFYDEKDIVQDSQFTGEFTSADLGLAVTVSKDGESVGRYLIRLTEGGGTSDYRATLFKLHESVFVDVMPKNERNLFENYKEGAPTASGLLKYASHDGTMSSSKNLHVVFKVSISAKGIECFGAKKFEDSSNPIKQDSKLKFHANGDNMVVDEATESLRSFISGYAGTNWSTLFQSGGLKLIRTAAGKLEAK